MRREDFEDDNINLEEPSLNDLIIEDNEEIMPPTVTDEEVMEGQIRITRKNILDVWVAERAANRSNKENIYSFLKKIIKNILIFLAVYVSLDSLSLIKVEEWTLRLVIISVFGVVASIFTIIVKHMFPENGDKQFLDFMLKIYTNNPENISINQSDEEF